jgi:bacterioferritin-associated ferredoxin
MYICLCNCFRETELRAAVDGGARTAAEVFESLGFQPQCGGRLDFADTVVEEYLAERSAGRRGGGYGNGPARQSSPDSIWLCR